MRTERLKRIKAVFTAWCGKRNEVYTKFLGDGDVFTNGDVLKANVYTVMGIIVIFSSERIVEIIVKNFLF